MFKNRRARAALSIAALAALIILSLTGCTILLSIFGTATGTVEGWVSNSVTDQGISGVLVTVVGESDYSATTDSLGNFSFDVPTGSVTLHFALSGFTFSDATVSVNSGQTTQVAWSLTEGTPLTGTVEGTVWNSITGYGLSGVAITVVGQTGYATTTDTYGDFSFAVPAGSMTLHFVLTGYQFSDVTVTVIAGVTTSVPYGATAANQNLSSNQYRFVLTWGASPSDLDSHLLTPNGYEVYYSDDAPTGAGANLDVDDMSGYGPETITITTVQTTGTYTYFVDNYSEYPAITTSSAQVRVYNSAGLMKTYSIPTTGTGYFWVVCTLTGATGVLTDQNYITSTDPGSTSYHGIARAIAK